MTRPILVISLCAAALAGCAHPVRETIVERPVVIERPMVAAAPLSCNYADSAYAHGSLSCQTGYQHRCSNGVWERIPGGYC